MELFETSSHFIVQDGEHALWCSRETGVLEARPASDLCTVSDLNCLGIVHGVIGRVEVGKEPDCNWLMLIAKQNECGILPGGNKIFRIDCVIFLPLCPRNFHANIEVNNASSQNPVIVGPEPDETIDESVRFITTSNLQRCPKHQPGLAVEGLGASHGSSSSMLSSQGIANPNVLKRTLGNFLGSNNIETSTRYRRPGSRTSRRVGESIDKLYNDASSFFYSPSADITASTWRLTSNLAMNKQSLVADDRFFWNKHLLRDLFSVVVSCIFGLFSKMNHKINIPYLLTDDITVPSMLNLPPLVNFLSILVCFTIYFLNEIASFYFYLFISKFIRVFNALCMCYPIEPDIILLDCSNHPRLCAV